MGSTGIIDPPEQFVVGSYGIIDPAYNSAMGSSEIIDPTLCETLRSNRIIDLPLGSMRMSGEGTTDLSHIAFNNTLRAKSERKGHATLTDAQCYFLVDEVTVHNEVIRRKVNTAKMH